jgi:branched-chain amino acid transport system permease protein
MLVFLAATHLANYLYPVTAGVAIPTTIIDGTFKLGKVRISYQMLLAALTGILVTLLFAFMFLKTRVGLIIRAMSQDIQASRLMGADVDKMYYLAMTLSVIPPTICVLMIAPFWSVDPFMGAPLLMTAMLVSILGGLGSLKGSITASYMIGFIHASVSFLYVSRFMGFAALVITLLVMIFKRGGLYPGETIW